MGKLKDKLIDMGGYTKEGLSNLRNQDREVGPSQARMKGLKSDIGGMARDRKSTRLNSSH